MTSSGAEAGRTLANLNMVQLKAYQAKDLEALGFVILNDSMKIVPYHRAALWEWKEEHPKLLGVSGQSTMSKTGPLAMNWQSLVKQIPEPSKPKALFETSFPRDCAEWKYIKKETPAKMFYWLPLTFEGPRKIGLWLERWTDEGWTEEEEKLLRFLAKGYGAASDRFAPKVMHHILTKRNIGIACLVVALSLIIIRLPLRIVAPCEVVPADPFVIATPLTGTIDHITVKSGQTVVRDDLLLLYEKRIPLQNLEVAKKQLEQTEAELQRALSLSLRDDRHLADVGVLTLKAEKERLNVDLQEYQAKRLEVMAPTAGVVSIENPEQWRGKAVEVGERVMTISDPNKTKIRVWMAEKDNVPLNWSLPGKVILNPTPDKSYYVNLTYVSTYVTVTEKGTPSFIAEADWAEQPPDAKIGVKGTGVLYGERVSLLYWLLRRPWNTLREFLGV